MVGQVLNPATATAVMTLVNLVMPWMAKPDQPVRTGTGTAVVVAGELVPDRRHRRWLMASRS
jgi:hypothetical protein